MPSYRYFALPFTWELEVVAFSDNFGKGFAHLAPGISRVLLSTQHLHHVEDVLLFVHPE